MNILFLNYIIGDTLTKSHLQEYTRNQTVTLTIWVMQWCWSVMVLKVVKTIGSSKTGQKSVMCREWHYSTSWSSKLLLLWIHTVFFVLCLNKMFLLSVGGLVGEKVVTCDSFATATIRAALLATPCTLLCDSLTLSSMRN